MLLHSWSPYFRSALLAAALIAAGAHGVNPSVSDAQVVRSKKPDRRVYQPPTAVYQASESDDAAGEQVQLRGGPLIDAALDDLQPVSHSEVILKRTPQRLHEKQPAADIDLGATSRQVVWEGNASFPTEYPSGPPLYDDEPVYTEEVGCGCESCVGSSMGCCDSGCCDGGFGCDSCCAIDANCGNARLCVNRDEWFGSVELLLMFRDGIVPPALVTTGPSTDAATAGVIGNPATEFLVGNANAFSDLTVGGRFTLGTWLDHSQCRSLVFRGWFGGRETFDFATDSTQTPVIVRPFFDVTDAQTPAQNNVLIAFPGRTQGDIQVNADSTVYGGDIAVRQFWFGGLGATVDVLYGYQYMRLDESLDIATNSVAINNPPTPVGAVQSVLDSFQADNEFHGGQIGLAARYRENCWSFNGLIKTGFGPVTRRANLRGQTTTTVGNDVDLSNEGFLVQSTNSGRTSDSTFGWVPELDASLGWHRFPRFDVTCGYHVVAMSDALRVFRTVDPQLAVNSAPTPTGQLRPATQFSYETFFVHGIHFGLEYRY